MVFKKLFKNRLKVFASLVVVGYLLSCIGLVFNCVSVYGNSNSIELDKSIVKVNSIVEDGSVLLDNGIVLGDSEIKSYAKIGKGKGTWYSVDSKCLVVEITNYDLIKMLVVPYIYLVLSVILFIKGLNDKWILGSMFGRIYLGVSIIVSVLFISLVFFFVG